MQEIIDATHDSEHGSVYGYVSDNLTNLKNYLSDFCTNEQIDEIITSLNTKESQKYAIIKSINVDEDHRNKGIGSELLEYFLDEAYCFGAEFCFLIADTNESNNFNLVGWYSQSFEFDILTELSSGCLMYRDLMI